MREVAGCGHLRHFEDANENGLFDGGDTLLADYTYTVGIDGKRLSEVESVTGATFDWVYDALGRLIKETYEVDGDPTGDFTAEYFFDLASNRALKQVDLGNDSNVDDYFAYEYDDNDRLLIELALAGSVNQTTFYEYDGTQQVRQTVSTTPTN